MKLRPRPEPLRHESPGRRPDPQPVEVIGPSDVMYVGERAVRATPLGRGAYGAVHDVLDAGPPSVMKLMHDANPGVLAAERENLTLAVDAGVDAPKPGDFGLATTRASGGPESTGRRAFLQMEKRAGHTVNELPPLHQNQAVEVLFQMVKSLRGMHFAKAPMAHGDPHIGNFVIHRSRESVHPPTLEELRSIAPIDFGLSRAAAPRDIARDLRRMMVDTLMLLNRGVEEGAILDHFPHYLQTSIHDARLRQVFDDADMLRYENPDAFLRDLKPYVRPELRVDLSDTPEPSRPASMHDLMAGSSNAVTAPLPVPTTAPITTIPVTPLPSQHAAPNVAPPAREPATAVVTTVPVRRRDSDWW